MSDSDSSTFANAPFSVVRNVAIGNGLMFALGILVASYVYFSFPVPKMISHVIAGGSEDVSVETYLFLFPVFQFWVFFMPMSLALRWQHVMKKSLAAEKQQRTKSAGSETYDATSIYIMTCTLICGLAVILLAMSLYRSGNLIFPSLRILSQ